MTAVHDDIKMTDFSFVLCLDTMQTGKHDICQLDISTSIHANTHTHICVNI